MSHIQDYADTDCVEIEHIRIFNPHGERLQKICEEEQIPIHALLRKMVVEFLSVEFPDAEGVYGSNRRVEGFISNDTWEVVCEIATDRGKGKWAIIREALGLWADAVSKNPDAAKQETQSLNLQFSASDIDELCQIAEQDGKSVRALIRRAVQTYLRQRLQETT